MPKADNLVVSKHRDGAFNSIGKAIEAAEPGAEILVEAGTYEETITISKPVVLVGQEGVFVTGRGGGVLRLEAETACVKGFSLKMRQAPGSPRFAVDVPAGHLIIEDCEILSLSLAAVAVSGRDASIEMRHCTITSENDGGVLFNRGRGLLEDCKIVNSRFAGIEVRMYATPEIRRCVVLGNREDGIFVNDRAGGLIESCLIARNRNSGIAVAKEGRPVVRHCKIVGNRQVGVWADYSAAGEVSHCEIVGNREGAWWLERGHQVQRNGNLDSWIRTIIASAGRQLKRQIKAQLEPNGQGQEAD